MSEDRIWGPPPHDPSRRAFIRYCERAATQNRELSPADWLDRPAARYARGMAEIVLLLAAYLRELAPEEHPFWGIPEHGRSEPDPWPEEP